MVRPRRLLFLICVLLSGALSACDTFLAGEKRTATLPIDSKILITLSEQLGPQRRALILNCRTEKIYECSNYPIAYALTRMGGLVHVRFRHVFIPEICLTSFGPATAAIDLGALGNGTYRLIISSNGNQVDAELEVTTGSYVVQRGDGPTINFPAPKLNRVPDYTVWGLIGYLRLGQPSDSLAQTFLDSLVVRGAESHAFESGDYGYFSIDQAGMIESPPNHGYYYARPYVLRFAGDPAALRDVVKYFAKTQGRWLSIRLLTWRGDTYYSWVLGSEP